MDEKPTKHQFVHIPPVEYVDITNDNNRFNENGSENDGDENVPLGLTGKAVCMQVCGNSIVRPLFYIFKFDGNLKNIYIIRRIVHNR